MMFDFSKPKNNYNLKVRVKLYDVSMSRRISQSELSELSGVANGYISELESGLKVPSILTICKLAKALECNPKELYICYESI